MGSNSLCLRVPQGLILSGSEQYCPMKPEPGAGRAQDIREPSQVRSQVQEGALAGLYIHGTLCRGHVAFPNLFLPSTQPGGCKDSDKSHKQHTVIHTLG